MKKRYIALIALFIIGILSGSICFVSAASSSKQAAKLYQVLRARLLYAPKNFYGSHSFIVQDLSRPDLSVSYRAGKVFPAASLIKLPLLAAAVKAVNEKRVSFSSIFTVRRSDVVSGSGIIKSMRLPARFNFRKILELMIVYSDNSATNKVIEILGYDYINESFRELGLKNTVLKRKMMDFSKRKYGVDNLTTTEEIAYLLERIYKRKLIGKNSSAFMIALLKKQKMRDRIPRYLPADITVAHKTGLEKGVVHDAGIVFSPKGDYLICVLTKGVKNYNRAKQFIARLSLITYELYQNYS